MIAIRNVKLGSEHLQVLIEANDPRTIFQNADVKMEDAPDGALALYVPLPADANALADSDDMTSSRGLKLARKLEVGMQAEFDAAVGIDGDVRFGTAGATTFTFAMGSGIATAGCFWGLDVKANRAIALNRQGTLNFRVSNPDHAEYTLAGTAYDDQVELAFTGRADITGSMGISSTLSADGNLRIGDAGADKFTVDASSGATYAAGSITAAGHVLAHHNLQIRPGEGDQADNAISAMALQVPFPPQYVPGANAYSLTDAEDITSTRGLKLDRKLEVGMDAWLKAALQADGAITLGTRNATKDVEILSDLVVREDLHVQGATSGEGNSQGFGVVFDTKLRIGGGRQQCVVAAREAWQRLLLFGKNLPCELHTSPSKRSGCR